MTHCSSMHEFNGQTRDALRSLVENIYTHIIHRNIPFSLNLGICKVTTAPKHLKLQGGSVPLALGPAGAAQLPADAAELCGYLGGSACPAGAMRGSWGFGAMV